MTETAIPLRRAYAKFSKKRLGYKPVQLKHVWDMATEKYILKNEGRGTVHTLPGASKIVRVGEDEIVVTDGTWGYTPFKLSELQLMLKEAKKLPIQTEFKVNSIK